MGYLFSLLKRHHLSSDKGMLLFKSCFESILDLRVSFQKGIFIFLGDLL